MLQIKDVHKSFGDKHVLNGVNLHVAKNTSMVIVGKSGMGKSVLFKSILGLMKIDQGDIIADGISVNDIFKRSNYISKFSMLFQNSALFDSMTVAENITFGLIEKGIKKQYAIKEAEAILENVGLDKKILNLYPSELSGGMQKRVSLARSIIVNPQIILFDEPTSGLDPITGLIIVDLIKKILDENELTAITITHDMNVAKKIADNVAFLNDGKIAWQGTKDEFLKSNDSLINSFINAQNIR